jgi:hypothetical protein
VTGGPLGGALRLTLRAPRLWAVGLAGFLARGGIVLFALPIVVLPSVVGLITFIGPNSVTAAGLAPRFVTLVAIVTAGLVAWIVVATIVAAATDVALIGAVVHAMGTGSAPAVRRPGLATLFVIRLASLVPFALGVALGGVRLGQVGYQELILPSNGTSHFVIRVLQGAPEVIALLLVTWLLTELIGAVAVRLAIVEGRTAAGSLGGSPVWIARRPLRSLVVAAGTVIGSILVLTPAIIVAAVAWEAVRTALLGDAGPIVDVVNVVLFVGVWAVAVVLAGIVATWRSAAWSLAVVEDHRGGGLVDQGDGTL